ncbi:hypothetical protein ABTB62_19345, partial [Acinetobacter baumannii]
RRLGIEARAATLTAKAAPEAAAEVESALKRLTDTGRGGMGSMFKVIGVSQPGLRELAGLSDQPPNERGNEP